MEQREILFRGKRIDNGEWIEGDLLLNNGSPIIVRQVDRPYIGMQRASDQQVGTGTHWYIETPAYAVEEKSISQFTGLTDKNGVRIFEGDKVNHWKDGDCIVKWNPFVCSFQLHPFPYLDTTASVMIHYVEKNFYTVIGNIYEA